MAKHTTPQFDQKYLPPREGRWLGRSGETTNSFAAFKQRARSNWKRWGQGHIERHHRGLDLTK